MKVPQSVNKVSFIDFGKNYKRHKKEIDQAIKRVLSNGDLILRQDVEDFEKSFAEYVGTKYCVALNSGTDALYLALKAIGVSDNQPVSVPSHTFVATAQVVVQANGNPILYDLGDTPDQPVKIVALIAGELSPVPQGIVIEDACQALGALKNPTSTAQAWSFYPAKTLGCYGDGGALTTNDENVYNYVKEARNHFKTNWSDWGINSRLDNIQAAILNVKLKYLDNDIRRRKEIADMYTDNLKGVGLPTIREVYQDYIIQTPRRDELYDYLKEHDIETMKNEYPMPIGKLPKAALYEAEGLRIPCNPELTDKEVQYVINTINNFYEDTNNG